MVLDANLQPSSNIYHIPRDRRLLVDIALQLKSKEKFLSTQQGKGINKIEGKYVLQLIFLQKTLCHGTVRKKIKEICHKLTTWYLHR